jgi:hypothetical protein
MRDFDTSPMDYDDYNNDHLYDGEKVYCFHYGRIDEAYAIREDGEDYDDFVDEVEWHLRRKHGRNTSISLIEDVTGTFE